MVQYKTLLIFRIIAGFTALTTAVIAFASKALHAAHRWHVYSGMVFLWSMGVVFITAIPMALLKANTFLFFIAISAFT